MIEDTAYALLKKAMIGAGDSEIHADCFVTVLKLTGATNDITDIRNIINSDSLLKKLEDKSKFADFVCSPSGAIFLALLFCFVFAFCCVCLKRCCCSGTRKPIIIQMANPPLHSSNTNAPYTRMDFA